MEFQNHIGKLYFNKAIKIEYDKPITIGIPIYLNFSTYTKFKLFKLLWS